MVEGVLPPQTTPLIGREKELAEVRRRLAQPECRLLTLVGPGGVGKTRLAIAVAAEVKGEYKDGLFFADLQSVDASDFITALADALPLTLSGSEPPRKQLLGYLQDKNLLLLLDNFEHLLDRIPLLTHLLTHAPEINMLLTSREALNLQDEWLYPLKGLAAPVQTGKEKLEKIGSVQLFLEQARRLDPSFSLEENREGVSRICQLVEGLPLALELAASWTRGIPCDRIADEIKHNLDFLRTRRRDLPTRHRSIQAVFQQSWRMLDDTEREVFKRLSTFRGSFDHGAAYAVAGASLPLLSALVDKSLLRREGESRYRVHELLRQYAAEKLQTSREEERDARMQHCAYFLDYLADRAPDLHGGRQRAATVAIERELDNVRSAWKYAAEHGTVEENHSSFDALYHFYQFQGRYREGADAFARAVRSLEAHPATPETERVHADLLVCHAWLYIRLGRLELARALLQKSQKMYNQLDIKPPDGLGSRDPLIPLGILAILEGGYAEAVRLGEEALHINEKRGDKGNLKYACYLLANALRNQGKYEEALVYARRSCTLAQEMRDRWGMAYFLNTLGSIVQAQGDYIQARRHYQASYDRRKSFEDPEGMAVALQNLGRIAIEQNEYGEARKLFEESLGLYREIGDRGGLAASLKGLGRVEVALKKAGTGAEHFRNALQLAADINFLPLMLSTLSEIAELFIQTGQKQKGVELLSLVHQHAAEDSQVKVHARQRLQACKDILPGEDFAQAVEAGKGRDFETVLVLMESELKSLKKDTTQSDDQPLAEPLTPRELEVLELIDKGLSNREIADKLVIAVGTVKWYTNQIYGKLNVSSRLRAATRARELGLFSNP